MYHFIDIYRELHNPPPPPNGLTSRINFTFTFTYIRLYTCTSIDPYNFDQPFNRKVVPKNNLKI